MKEADRTRIVTQLYRKYSLLRLGLSEFRRHTWNQTVRSHTARQMTYLCDTFRELPGKPPLDMTVRFTLELIPSSIPDQPVYPPVSQLRAQDLCHKAS